MTVPISARDILDQLDSLSGSSGMWSFPELDNGYLHPVAVRLSGFSGQARWALVIEEVSVSERCLGHEQVQHWAYCYGNCLAVPAGLQHAPGVITADGAGGPTFPSVAGSHEFVRPEARTIRLRGVEVPIPRDRQEYAAHGTNLTEPPAIDAVALMRLLAVRHDDLLFLPEEALAALLAARPPQILRLREWHHPSAVMANERPSDTQTFRMIAEALATADPARYRPDEPPNTHWRHHPTAGTL